MTDPTAAPDLNALLAEEQTAIMTAEAAGDDRARDEQREIARQARGEVDLTPFPRREPHDFERPLPPACSQSDHSDQFILEFEALKQQVEAMDKQLGVQLSEGTIGTKHNVYEHRARLVRQARGRLSVLGEASGAALRL